MSIPYSARFERVVTPLGVDDDGRSAPPES
jgi:hypothetical protein